MLRFSLVRGIFFYCFLSCTIAAAPCCHASAQASSFGRRYSLAAASVPYLQQQQKCRQRQQQQYRPSRSRRRGRYLALFKAGYDCSSNERVESEDDASFDAYYPFGQQTGGQNVVEAARKTKASKDPIHTEYVSSVTRQEQGVAGDGILIQQGEGRLPYSYKDLTPLGKIVAGTVEVAVVTAIDYLQGLVGGYFLGTLTDVPRLLFRPLQSNVPRPLMNELGGRFLRMHQKSARWGKSWGGISATYGGLCVAARVLRGGAEDEWNVILGTMAAGAMFARKDGPQAMLRGALVYGGLTYMLSKGSLSKSKGQLFESQDQPLEF